MPGMAGDPDDVVEVFEAESIFAAQRIADTLLIPEGIDAQVVDRTAHELPGVGQPGSVVVFVPPDQRVKALAIIEEARANGYLEPEDGEVSERPVEKEPPG
jgi:hypothetical protein